MKNSTNKIIAATVCGVMVGSFTTAILGDFNIKNGIEADDKEIEFASGESIVKEENLNNEEKNIIQEDIENNNLNSDKDLLINNTNELNVDIEIDKSINISEDDNLKNYQNNVNSNTGSGNQSNAQKPSSGIILPPQTTDKPIEEKPSQSEENPKQETKPQVQPEAKPDVDIKPEVKPEQVLVYYDGAYTATSTGWDDGLQVKVDIYRDKIARVTVVSHNETIGICDKAIELIPYRITASQSTNVDVISGATLTSNGIIKAVNIALSKAKR